MNIIEQLYTAYEASYTDGIPYSDEQQKEFDEFTALLDKIFPDFKDDEKQQQIFDSSVSLYQASEKAGFVLGFKMALKIMLECKAE